MQKYFASLNMVIHINSKQHCLFYRIWNWINKKVLCCYSKLTYVKTNSILSVLFLDCIKWNTKYYSMAILYRTIISIILDVIMPVGKRHLEFYSINNDVFLEINNFEYITY